MIPNDVINLATSYAVAGIPVFPIAIDWDDRKQKTNKVPLTGTGGFHRASTDPDEVRALFDQAPGHLARLVREGRIADDAVVAVGVRPGPAGFVVVDLDVGAAADGVACWKDLCIEYGDPGDTPTVVTGSGGQHRWFRKPTGVDVGNAHDLGVGIDVRSDDGFVVAPGTDTQWGIWAWDGPGVLDDGLTIPVIPDWVHRRLRPSGRGSGPAERNIDLDSLEVPDRAAVDALKRLGGHGIFRRVDSDGACWYALTRPGKTAGVSASVGFLGPGIVKIFTSSWPGLAHGGIYDADELAVIADGGSPAECDPGLPETEVPAKYLSTRLDAVEPEQVQWLWPGRLPRGKLAVLDGDPDVGKSTLALDIVARTSTGREMPGDRRSIEPADVVLMAAEDGLGDTIRPRLDAAGADAARVHHLDKVPRINTETGETAWTFPSIPEDIDALDALVADTGAVLVIIDVLMAYLSGKADSHKDQDVRRNLESLADLADRRGCCILLLRHLRKSRGSALYAGGGSVGIVGLARAGMIAALDPDDETGHRRILARSKGNLAAPWRSLAYTLIADQPGGVARVEWLGEVETSADQLLTHRLEADDDTEDASTVLAEILADGPVWVKVAVDSMAEAGFTKDQAKRAKKKLKVSSVKFGRPGDKDQGWKWVLPSHEGRTKDAKECTSGTPPPSLPSCALQEQPLPDLGPRTTGDAAVF